MGSSGVTSGFYSGYSSLVSSCAGGLGEAAGRPGLAYPGSIGPPLPRPIGAPLPLPIPGGPTPGGPPLPLALGIPLPMGADAGVALAFKSSSVHNLGISRLPSLRLDLVSPNLGPLIFSYNCFTLSLYCLLLASDPVDE